MDCGAARSPSDDGQQPLYTRGGFRKRVQEYVDADWSVGSDEGDRVTVTHRDLGGLLAHASLLLFILTAVWGNLLYALWRWVSSTTRETLSAYEPPEQWPDIDPRPAGGTAHYVGAMVLLLFLALFLSAGFDDPSNPVGWLWIASLLLGIAHLLPPVRRRLQDRGSVRSFGQTKSTDESIAFGKQNCVVCGTIADTSVRRTYKEQFVVAGVPLWTSDEGENHYCESCASPNSVLTDALTDDTTNRAADSPLADEVASTGPAEQEQTSRN